MHALWPLLLNRGAMLCPYKARYWTNEGTYPPNRGLRARCGGLEHEQTAWVASTNVIMFVKMVPDRE